MKRESLRENLFDNFPPVTREEWMDKIRADLKGADFDKKLVWETNEGFKVQPFYREEDIENLPYINTLPGECPYIRGSRLRDNSWRIRQDIEISDYKKANLKALDILMKGVDSLGFIIKDPESVCEKNFNHLLKDIQANSIELNFLCNGKAKEILGHISKISADRGLDHQDVHGAIEADPISRLLINGKLCLPIDSAFNYLASFTEAAIPYPNLRTIHLNASTFNNAGGNIVQELAFAVSMGNEYLVQLTQRGLSPEVAASKIRFSFGIGSNYFSEIAKLRAARLLWSVVQKGFQSENPLKMDIHCVTSEWNKTILDKYVNLLRTQTEAMSAILGGTDSLTVEPFDKTFRAPDEFSERIARNQQLILREEAYFDKVADPAAGSYYIENLTSLIAENAWKLFIKIEEKGGFLEAIKSGIVQKLLYESACKRVKDIADGKEVLLGTNKYPDMSEKTDPEIDLNKVYRAPLKENNLLIEPVRLFRGAEGFEKERLGISIEKEYV